MDLNANSQIGILVDKSNADPSQYYGDNLKIFSDDYYRAEKAIEEYEKERETFQNREVSLLGFIKLLFSRGV